MKDKLGDKLKQLEKAGEVYPDKNLPIVIRLDGKGFTKWTKKIKCKKPFDDKLANVMAEVTKELVTYCNADIGYTQSDEITLIITRKSESDDLMFGGRFQKLCSVLASLATYHLNKHYDVMALFDCRAFSVPDKDTAVECLEWRGMDCRRNSVSGLARSLFSHSLLHKKSTREMMAMLVEGGKDWNDVEPKFKNGIIILRDKVTSKLSEEDLKDLPEKHHARLNPDLIIERTQLVEKHESILDTKNKYKFAFRD